LLFQNPHLTKGLSSKYAPALIFPSGMLFSFLLGAYYRPMNVYIFGALSIWRLTMLFVDSMIGTYLVYPGYNVKRLVSQEPITNHVPQVLPKRRCFICLCLQRHYNPIN
jgi:hypothetical protein